MKNNRLMHFVLSSFLSLKNKLQVDRGTVSMKMVTGFVMMAFILANNQRMFAQPNENLEAYIKIAADNNPQLQAAFQQYEASLQRVNQAGTLENPELNLGMFLRPMELLMGNQSGEVSVMQMFPWFGMLKIQKEEASYMAEAKYALFRERRNNLLYEVKETYYALILLKNEQDILEKNLEILASMERILLVKYQGGNQEQATSGARNSTPVERKSKSSSAADPMSMGGNSTGSQTTSTQTTSAMSSMSGGKSGTGLTEIYRVQVQIRTLKTRLEQVAEDKVPLMAKFNALLNRAPDSPVNLDGLPAPLWQSEDFGWALDSALKYNPMIQMYEAEQLAFQKQGEMASIEGKPMFGLGLNYMLFSARPEQGAIGAMNGMDYMPAGMGNNMIMPMVNLTLPIYRKKYKSMQAEARFYEQATISTKREVENQLTIQLASIKRDVAAADRSLDLINYQKEMTQKMLDLALTAYTTEAAAYEDLLLIRQELLQYQLSEVEALVSKYLAYAALEKMIGY